MTFNGFCGKYVVTELEREELRMFLLSIRVKKFLEATRNGK